MTNKISFIHAADLHLDSPFKGLSHLPQHIFHEIKNSTFLALDKLVTVAISKQVDFVLMVGDLFDNEVQSLRAQIKLRRAFEKLRDHDIDVYISYGNHDFINGNVHEVTYPENVHIFPNEEITSFIYEKNGKELASIYGFSYENRAVKAAKAKEFNIEKQEIPFHIAMLHGSLGNNPDHDVYAPFQLSDLIEKNFDYWALGHIHKREVLKEQPPIVYPGNIQGRNKKETGEKGCYYVEISDAGSRLSFIPLQQILFHNLEVDLESCQTLHDVETEIQNILLNDDKGKMLVELSLKGNANLQYWNSSGQLDEVMEIINETNVMSSSWKYIFHVNVNIIDEQLIEQLVKGDHFIGEMIKQTEDVDMMESVKELFHHKGARKYLVPFTEEEQNEIKEKVKELLVHELLKG